MQHTIKLSRTRDKVKQISLLLFLVVLFFTSFIVLDLEPHKFITRLAEAGSIISKLLVLDFSNISTILFEMGVSLAIAVSGIFIGLIIALILTFLAAENIAPNRVLASFIKGTIAVIRAIPTIIWILMVVASIGFGNTGGMIGLMISTIGYLTKAFTASVEDLGTDIVEALRATGASWLSIVTKGLLPSATRPFISWGAIKIEMGIAESINLGMIGVGGVGTLLMKAFTNYDYAAISMIIVVIFITMLIIELCSQRFKQTL